MVKISDDKESKLEESELFETLIVNYYKEHILPSKRRQIFKGKHSFNIIKDQPYFYFYSDRQVSATVRTT